MKNPKDNVEELKLFILKLLANEQDAHAQNTDALKKALGSEISKDTIKLLNEIFRAKTDMLEKVLDKINKL